MTKIEITNLVNLINAKLMVLLGTNNLVDIRNWWDTPNSLFGGSPFEYVISFRHDGLVDVLNVVSYYKGF